MNAQYLTSAELLIRQTEPRLKRVFQRLSRFGDAVSKLHILASGDEDEQLVPIDLINDRIFESVSVNDDGRELDKEHCCSCLRAALNGNQDEIRRQLGNRGQDGA